MVQQLPRQVIAKYYSLFSQEMISILRKQTCLMSNAASGSRVQTE